MISRTSTGLVIGALVIGAVAGWFTLPIAVLGHEISEFVVIGSGLRMLHSGSGLLSTSAKVG